MRSSLLLVAASVYYSRFSDEHLFLHPSLFPSIPLSFFPSFLLSLPPSFPPDIPSLPPHIISPFLPLEISRRVNLSGDQGVVDLPDKRRGRRDVLAAAKVRA